MHSKFIIDWQIFVCVFSPFFQPHVVPCCHYCHVLLFLGWYRFVHSLGADKCPPLLRSLFLCALLQALLFSFRHTPAIRKVIAVYKEWFQVGAVLSLCFSVWIVVSVTHTSMATADGFVG